MAVIYNEAGRNAESRFRTRACWKVSLTMAYVACPLCRNDSGLTVNNLLSALVEFLENPLRCPLCAFTASCSPVMHQHLIQHRSNADADALPASQSATAHSCVKVMSDPVAKCSKFHCKLCPMYQTDDVVAWRTHVESDHPDRKFICTRCCKLFKAEASLTLHMKMAHGSGNDIHQCKFCRKLFTTCHRKELHEKRHAESSAVDSALEMSPCEETKSFACPFCEKSFKKDQYLQQHIRTHEAKKWECQVCRKLFTTKEYLRKHSRLHTGETPYSCDLCGKTFTFQQSYHKHLLYHSDERPYECDQCGRRFKELSTLHNHQRIHTGEKPYSCDTCGKSFRQRVSFVVHKRIHTGALPYACTTCGKSFRYKVSQRTHKCEVHRQEDATTAAVVDEDVTSSIVRNRPTWLERLVTAQQQSVGAYHQHVMADASGDVIADDVTAEMDQSPSPVVLNEAPSCPSPLVAFDPKTYYQTDGLPSFDLSQLTLNFDSELIFPS